MASQNPSAPSLRSKVAYGIGAIADGARDNGFNYFLLIFYSQVVGLDARLVGLALTLALIVDAIVDPLLGFWSDNLRSKWGRRHPFMYAAAIPAAATYFLLWIPPEGASQEALFWRLLTLAVLIRTFFAVFETPSNALAAELTDDYDQRSTLISYRYYFGWTGGNLITVLMFLLVFPTFATAATPDGQFNRDAYVAYAWITSGFMLAAILISSIGTHPDIPRLRSPPPKRALTVGTVFKEILEPLANRSFGAVFVAWAFGAIGTGLAAALSFYLLTYFWGFSGAQIAVITLGVFISAIIGAILAPIATRTIGKKRAAMIIGVVAFLGSPLPIGLRVLGLLPDDPTFVFWFVFIAGVIDLGLIICFQILLSSMVADLVEQAELKTGRRSEGLFFATVTFIRKLVQGLGVMAAGFVLSLAQFPEGAAPGEVSADAVWRLGAYYVPSILAVWMAMMVAVSTYKLERKDHEENLRKLAAGAQAQD